MRTLRTAAVIMTVLSAHFLMSGCSSSALVDIWSDEAFQSTPLQKFFVIAAENDPVKRRIWEDIYTAELTKHSLTVTPSYRLFPGAVPDTDQVLYAVNTNGFDGVLITRRMPVETQPQYGQSSVIVLRNMRYDRRRSRFITYYHTIDRYGYVDPHKVYINDIDVWSIKNDGQLIWSATSRSHEPMGTGENRTEIAKQVMDELTDRGIIAPRR